MALAPRKPAHKALGQVARADPVPGLVAVYLRILTRQGELAEAAEFGRRALGDMHEEDTWGRDSWFALA